MSILLSYCLLLKYSYWGKAQRLKWILRKSLTLARVDIHCKCITLPSLTLQVSTGGPMSIWSWLTLCCDYSFGGILVAEILFFPPQYKSKPEGTTANDDKPAKRSCDLWLQECTLDLYSTSKGSSHFGPHVKRHAIDTKRVSRGNEAVGNGSLGCQCPPEECEETSAQRARTSYQCGSNLVSTSSPLVETHCVTWQLIEIQQVHDAVSNPLGDPDAKDILMYNRRWQASLASLVELNDKLMPLIHSLHCVM